MNNQRIRDMALGFAFCAALVGSFYCGASGSPTSANASALGSSDYAVVGGIVSEGVGYIIVDKVNKITVFADWMSLDPELPSE